MLKSVSLSAAVALALALAASHQVHAAADAPGAVFALTNAAGGNAVVLWPRAADGSLGPAVSTPTGGAGNGAGLGSQGAVVVSADRRYLFAVNAGSGSVSSFRIEPSGLHLVDVEASGGATPTSLTVHGGLLYVLNAGVPNTIAGLRVAADGSLEPLAGSARPLSAASTAPAEVAFTSDGRSLVVTERGTNVIDVYTVDAGGLADGPYVYASAGPVPFGFALDRQDNLVVSEAGTGGGASSYRVSGPVLTPVSSMVMTGQRAACWAILSKNGQFGYVTNAGTGNISGFSVDRDGTVALLDASGVTATTGGNPTDMAMSHDGRYLYARVAALAEIAVFRIGPDGALAPLAPLTGTPAGLAGLAGY
ncbi:MAG: lactonase family protein [Vicinamibacterales bacterium]